MLGKRCVLIMGYSLIISYQSSIYLAIAAVLPRLSVEYKRACVFNKGKKRNPQDYTGIERAVASLLSARHLEPLVHCCLQH